jgi:hypothetical protein
LAPANGATPAGATRPAASNRSRRSLFTLDQPLPGLRGVQSRARCSSSIRAGRESVPGCVVQRVRSISSRRSTQATASSLLTAARRVSA